MKKNDVVRRIYRMAIERKRFRNSMDELGGEIEINN